MEISNLRKICRVCGDRASCYNFDGLTCESCKSFFRRNALKYEKYSCLKEGKCTMDPVSRKCCTKCRLNKCFSIGMKKELIYSKLKKVPSSSSTKKEPALQIVKKRPSTAPLTKLEIQLEEMIRDKMSNVSLLFPATEETLPKIHLPKKVLYSIELNQYELQRIQEVNNAANEASFYDKAKFPIVGKVPNLLFALNLSELYIRKMIKLCKHISAFKCLNQQDQLIILKRFFTEMIIVCFSFTFMPEQDGYPIIEDENRQQALLIKLDILYEANKANFYYFCRQNLIRFHELLEEDTTIRDLILAKQLFKPRDNTLNCYEFLRYHHSVYERLLNRYLEHKHQSSEKAVERMNGIMEILNRIDQFRDILEGIFLEVDSTQLALLINEIYNLK